MTSTEEFGKRYLQYEKNIEKVLRELKIYDADLVHDTYIALYEHSQKEEITDYVSMFVAFYQKRYKRQETRESPYIACDNETMVEKYDRMDESDLEYREAVGERVDNLIGYYSAHPLPGERNHERAVMILRLYVAGYSYVEIAKILKIDESTVKKYFKRTINGLKSHAQKATI